MFTPIAKAVREEFPGAFVTVDIQTSTPTKFPCVALVEMDNFSPRSMRDSSGVEKYSDVMYQLWVYSNKATAKKADCKAVFRFVDDMMYSLGFNRESNTPQTPLNNNSIYWLSARYTARTDGHYIYQR